MRPAYPRVPQGMQRSGREGLHWALCPSSNTTTFPAIVPNVRVASAKTSASEQTLEVIRSLILPFLLHAFLSRSRALLPSPFAFLLMAFPPS